MKPMEPMEPMKPMQSGPAWWPDEFGEPATRGGQGEVEYAFFPDRRRLLIRRDGAVATYDSGDHQIDGVSQEQGGVLAFVGPDGSVPIDELTRL